MSEESFSILADWNRFFPGIPPVGYELRAALPERWVRFHSLPGSKRYPDNEPEYVELLTRFNAILRELARADESLTLVTTGYSTDPVPTRSYPQLFELDPDATHWLTIEMEDDEDDPIHWHFFASERQYSPRIFDSFVRSVAGECIANILIVASDYRWLLHPYDGGMDVIVESEKWRDLLRESHGNWLSARADGL